MHETGRNKRDTKTNDKYANNGVKLWMMDMWSDEQGTQHISSTNYILKISECCDLFIPSHDKKFPKNERLSSH
jgi:hypothetical protein